MQFINPQHEMAARDHIATLLREADQARLLRAAARPSLLRRLAQRLHWVRPAQLDHEVHIA